MRRRPAAPRRILQFTYEFHPTTLGAKSSSTTIGINSENFSITMSGTGISAFSVTPTNLNFGSVPEGASASLVVTITNTSGVSQTPNFSGGAPNDPVNFGGSQNCAGVPLPPGGSCQFTYEFHPTTLGAKSSSTTIGINSENFSITMSGTGISAFSVTPTNLNFGSVPDGASASLVVTITNTSGVSQTPNFSGGAPNDPVNFGGSQNCAGVPLPPGGSCQFAYEFHPTTLGAKSSSTTIGINSENFSITMSGTGISAFSVTPTNLNFGSVPEGASASLVVTITNTSGVLANAQLLRGAPERSRQLRWLSELRNSDPAAPRRILPIHLRIPSDDARRKVLKHDYRHQQREFPDHYVGNRGRLQCGTTDVAFGSVPLALLRRWR